MSPARRWVASKETDTISVITDEGHGLGSLNKRPLISSSGVQTDEAVAAEHRDRGFGPSHSTCLFWPRPLS